MSHAALKQQIAYKDGAFAQEVIDFLRGNRSGHLSKWLYSVPMFPGDRANGSEAWAQVAHEAKQGGPYYVFRDEERIIQDALPFLGTLFKKNTRLVDLGPGSEDALKNKVFPVMQGNAGLISEYMAVDVSTQSLAMAKNGVSKEFPGIKPVGIQGDFIQERFAFGAPVSNEVALFFGLTLCNLPIDPRVQGLPEKMLVASFEQLKSHFTAPEGYLVVTQDVNQTLETLRAAYLTRKPVYETLLHRIVRDLDVSGEFDPSGFSLDIDFFAETQACAMCFVARHDMDFSVEDRGINIKKDQRLYFHNAFKFHSDFFVNCARKAGFDLVQTVSRPDCQCHLQILKVRQKENHEDSE